MKMEIKVAVFAVIVEFRKPFACIGIHPAQLEYLERLPVYADARLNEEGIPRLSILTAMAASRMIGSEQHSSIEPSTMSSNRFENR